MRGFLRSALGLGLLGSFFCFQAPSQSVISARSGLIHYVEGAVFIGDQQVELKSSEFPQIQENQELRTGEGRAEVLLTPGVFLRVAENSSIRMLQNRLTDTRLELLAGSIVIEAADLLKDNGISVVLQGTAIQLRKNGLYRFDTDPARLRVYDGEALAGTQAVKEGRQLVLGEPIEKFDSKTGDALHRWSRRRAEYVAMANVSAAKSVYDSGLAWSAGGWRWNPWFGMFTFIPISGSIRSPYGFRYWNPVDVYQIYAPRPVFVSSFDSMPHYNSNLGYRTMGPTSGGYSGTVAAASPSVAAPTTSAAGAAASPVSRESGQAGGRSR